jgi:hypothetical protein
VQLGCAAGELRLVVTDDGEGRVEPRVADRAAAIVRAREAGIGERPGRLPGPAGTAAP